MAKKPVYTWFIEPDDQTNEIISQEMITEDCTSRRIICKDGKRHNLWQCSPDVIRNLMRMKRDRGLEFKIFNKRGYQGRPQQIRECTFLFSKKWRMRKRAKAKTAK